MISYEERNGRQIQTISPRYLLPTFMLVLWEDKVVWLERRRGEGIRVLVSRGASWVNKVRLLRLRLVEPESFPKVLHQFRRTLLCLLYLLWEEE